MADDGLARLQHLFDALFALGFFFHVVSLEGNVASIQDCVFGNSDVNESKFHSRQDVLNPSHVDVAVDLVRLIGHLCHGVFHEGATFECCNVRGVLRHVHTHEIATLGAATTCVAATSLIASALAATVAHSLGS